MNIERFVLTEDHVKLLARFNVNWWDAEFGAPSIDPKRPYGNSDVLRDIAKILRWKLSKISADEIGLSSLQVEKARQLHAQTETALQVILSTQSFVPGTYEREMYSRDWKLVKKRKCRVSC